ncbi:Ubiquitin carboxyl-terminal hydrolase 18 [Linum grandiflorum]
MTLVQHIFGGHLQSQVMCTKCSDISNQFENMMDLIVESHGDATFLEEYLDQFTAKEWLHDDNMYKCDSCNDYVKAWKHLILQYEVLQTFLISLISTFVSLLSYPLNRHFTLSVCNSR